MSVFDFHSTVLTDYRDFVRSFFTVADDRAREYVERALVAEARLWPDFLLQVSPSYVRTDTFEALAGRGELHGDRVSGGDSGDRCVVPGFDILLLAFQTRCGWQPAQLRPGDEIVTLPLTL
jgi:hypothetical protein